MNYLHTEVSGACDWLRMLKDMHPESETFDRTPPRPLFLKPLPFTLSVCPIQTRHTEHRDHRESVLQWAYAGGARRFRLMHLTPIEWAIHGGVDLYLMRANKDR